MLEVVVDCGHPVFPVALASGYYIEALVSTIISPGQPKDLVDESGKGGPMPLVGRPHWRYL